MAGQAPGSCRQLESSRLARSGRCVPEGGAAGGRQGAQGSQEPTLQTWEGSEPRVSAGFPGRRRHRREWPGPRSAAWLGHGPGDAEEAAGRLSVTHPAAVSPRGLEWRSSVASTSPPSSSRLGRGRERTGLPQSRCRPRGRFPRKRQHGCLLGLSSPDAVASQLEEKPEAWSWPDLSGPPHVR